MPHESLSHDAFAVDAPRPPAPSFVIRGVTLSGRTFRPSDWAERLSGVMSSFHPGARGPGAHLRYSPHVQPITDGDLKCVRVDGRLDALSSMAYRFLINFARDNDLQVEGLDPPPESKPGA